MKNVTTHEAKTHLSRLIQEVEKGTTVIIYRRDKAVAKLVRASSSSVKKTRPCVGETTSPPIAFASDAFAPLDGAALEAWGLGE